MNKLKPCPFCGGEMKMAIDGGFTKAYRAIHKDKCKYFNPNRETRLTQEEMINIWNARPIEDALAAENAELKEECRQNRTLKQDMQSLKDCYREKDKESEALKAKVAELEAENARMREALQRIANADTSKNIYEYAATTPRMLSNCIEIAEHVLKGGE